MKKKTKKKTKAHKEETEWKQGYVFAVWCIVAEAEISPWQQHNKLMMLHKVIRAQTAIKKNASSA